MSFSCRKRVYIKNAVIFNFQQLLVTRGTGKYFQLYTNRCVRIPWVNTNKTIEITVCSNSMKEREKLHLKTADLLPKFLHSHLYCEM